jgi:hypothetical protein
MAVYFDHPEKINGTFTSIHSKRILPAYIVHLMTKEKIKSFLGDTNDFQIPFAGWDRLDEEKPLNATIWKIIQQGFIRLNYLIILFTMFFLILILLHYELPPFQIFWLSAVFLTLPCFIKIYIDWSPMPDPTVTFFVMLAYYAYLKKEHLLFSVAIGLGSMASEKILVFLPFMFFSYFYHNKPIEKTLNYWRPMLYLLIPIAIYSYITAFPIFKNLQYVEVLSSSRTGQLFEYLSAVKFHFKSHLSDPLAIPKQITVFFNVFIALFYISVLYYRRVVNYLKNNPEWLIYIISLWVVSFYIDRDIFLLFPFFIGVTIYLFKEEQAIITPMYYHYSFLIVLLSIHLFIAFLVLPNEVFPVVNHTYFLQTNFMQFLKLSSLIFYHFTAVIILILHRYLIQRKEIWGK